MCLGHPTTYTFQKQSTTLREEKRKSRVNLSALLGVLGDFDLAEYPSFVTTSLKLVERSYVPLTKKELLEAELSIQEGWRLFSFLLDSLLFIFPARVSQSEFSHLDMRISQPEMDRSKIRSKSRGRERVNERTRAYCVSDLTAEYERF